MNDDEVGELTSYLYRLVMRADPKRRRVVISRMLHLYRECGINVVYRATGEQVSLEEGEVGVPEVFTKQTYTL